MSEKDDHEMVYEQLSEESGLRKVAELIKHLRIAMLTTAVEHISIRRRPMAIQNESFDGTPWLLTRSSSPNLDEISPRSGLIPGVVTARAGFSGPWHCII